MFKQKPEQKLTKLQNPSKKNMATLRLEKDIQSYLIQPISFVNMLFPDETLQTIHIIIQPQEDSPYYGCSIAFQLTFPNQYPIDAPKLKCLQRVYHPNINYEGCVCLPLIRQDYNPTINLTMIICALIFILTYPNGDDALVPNIGEQLIKNPQMFKKIVNYTCEGQTFENKIYHNIKIKQ